MRAPRIFLVIILLAGAFPLMLGGVEPAGASTFTVTRKNDPSPNGCNNNGCSLREAVIAANNHPGPDFIRLGRGRFELTRGAPDEDNSETGDLDIKKNVTITGAGPRKTIIDANGNDRIFDISPAVDGAKLSDLTMVGGKVVVDQETDVGGGAVRNFGKLSLANTFLENNRTNGGSGGAIANEGRLEIVNSRITGNRATNLGTGGAIYNATGRMILRNVRIDHNRAEGTYAGAIHNTVSATALLTKVRLDNNKLPAGCCGGAVFNELGASFSAVRSSFVSNVNAGCCGGAISNMGSDAEVFLRNVVIAENLNEGCCGGGLMTQDGKMILRDVLIARNKSMGCCAGGLMAQSGVVKLFNSRILSNTVPSGCCGGGILGQGATLTIVRTLIRNNRQQSGGGAGGGISLQTSGLALVLKDSTIAANSTTGDGGGISIGSTGSARITNSTISNNSAGASGGGIWEATPDQIDMTHVTISRNSSEGPGGGISTDGGTWSVLRSIIGNNEGSNDCNAVLVGPSGPNLDKDGDCFSGPGAIHRDPKLGPLTDNGGKTPTHVPRKASRAVDAASGASCPPPGRDQRGVKRPQNGDGEAGKKCDLGAVERKPNE